MLHMKDASKKPRNTGGNDKPPSKPGTPSDAVGRSGGAAPAGLDDQVRSTKVPKSSLTKTEMS